MDMKKPSKRKLKIFFSTVLIVSAFTVQPAQAQDSGSIVQVLNHIAARIDSIVSVVASYIFQPTPNIGTTVTTNYTNFTITPQIVSQVTQLADQDLTQGLSPTSESLTLNLTLLTKALRASDSVILGSAAQQALQSNALNFLRGTGPVPTTQQQALAANNANFDYQSLVSYPGYTQQQQAYALNYIRTVADMATPVSKFSLQDKIKNDKDFQTLQLRYQQQVINDVESSPKYQIYQARRRTILAQQSAGLTNLYRIYAKRIPQPSLQAGDSGLNTPAPSIQQIEDYIATWRVSNPNWYAQMSTAAPTTIARETLFVLAEIERELHNLHLDNERIITLMAINQVQSITAAKQGLVIIEPDAVQVYSDAVTKAKQDQSKVTGRGS